MQVLRDPVTHAISGARKLSDVVDEYNELHTNINVSWLALLEGWADREHIDQLVSALNMAEAFARLRPVALGRDCRPVIRAGQDALYTLAKRGVEAGDKFTLEGDELYAIGDVIELHRGQLDKVTVSDVDMALRIINEEIKHRRVRSLKALTDAHAPA